MNHGLTGEGWFDITLIPKVFSFTSFESLEKINDFDKFEKIINFA